MRIGTDGTSHLTYCSNVHPSNGLEGVMENLRTHTLGLKQRLSPDRAFGVGLRLSAKEAKELLEGDRLAAFEAFLESQGLYVFTLNGFPYGSFHHRPVKEQVFAPDWTQQARLTYTLDLIAILHTLLPHGLEGGISTVPLSFKAWSRHWGRPDVEIVLEHLIAVAERLIQLKRTTGKAIHLDLEPEPGATLETLKEAVGFFEGQLLPRGGRVLARRLGISQAKAQELLLEHLTVCLDTCHLAVEYEDPDAAVAPLLQAGIRIGKIQVSSALRVQHPTDPTLRKLVAEELKAFVEPVYLHQVMAQLTGGFQRFYPDLPHALLDMASVETHEWRIHYHVPLFLERYGLLDSTQPVTRRVLERWIHEPFSQHLEIETYTWDVLPAPLKQDLGRSLEREYRWVLDVLHACPPVPSGAEARLG